MSAQVHVPSLFARVGTASVLTLAVTSTMLAPGLVNEAEAATHSTKALKVAASKKGLPTSTERPVPAASTVRG